MAATACSSGGGGAAAAPVSSQDTHEGPVVRGDVVHGGVLVLEVDEMGRNRCHGRG